MSKKVKSDGSVERAMLKLVKDEKYGEGEIGQVVTDEHLRQCCLKALQEFKAIWTRRFGTRNLTVMQLLEKYITIRVKQSPHHRSKDSDDYGMLFAGVKPQPSGPPRKLGEAKSIDAMESESIREMLSNSQKCMQILDAGGQKPVDYLAGLFEQCGIMEDYAKNAANIIYEKLQHRMNSIRESQKKRFDIILKRLGTAADQHPNS